ncbi:NAD(P)-dependent oxidoreductase [Sphingomonas rhizophila]|uniref:NAD(P)-dependent oxidoreductase n=1 Tax=Sphingomonas rhizophila TaxID=2071607 RepID=A0A7G9SBU3_9SPHN|nr:NAD(P)-dependent oxidoreductase [Sphingomonas rhizophila]
MKVLVTGAGGFLGQAVVRACTAAGHEVVAMIRPMGRDPFAAPVTVVRGDLRQVGPWRTQLDGVEAVIHCAAATGGTWRRSSQGPSPQRKTCLR